MARYTLHPNAITPDTTDMDNTTPMLDLRHSACRDVLYNVLPLTCSLSSNVQRQLSTRAIRGGLFDGQPRCTCIVANHGGEQVYIRTEQVDSLFQALCDVMKSKFFEKGPVGALLMRDTSVGVDDLLECLDAAEVH